MFVSSAPPPFFVALFAVGGGDRGEQVRRKNHNVLRGNSISEQLTWSEFHRGGRSFGVVFLETLAA